MVPSSSDMANETAGEAAPEVLRAGHAAVAVAALFFVNGATFSNWLPRIPEIRDRLGLGNAGLGATLLGGGLGGILGALTVARVLRPLGSRRLLIAAATALSIGMPFIALVPVAPMLLALLTLLGTLDVFNDVSMNAQGVMVQQHIGRSIMNRLHAMWSLGFTSGAVIGSAASAAHLDIRIHLGVVGLLLLATVIVVQRWLVPADAPVEPVTNIPGAPTRRFATSPAMVAMAFAALAAISLEVLPNDWSAVLMRDVFKAGRFSGLGTVACAGAMLVGRLGGDHVLDRVGEQRLLRGALMVVAAGTVITVVAPVTALGVLGLVVWGLGLSVVFPQLYATAARLPGTSAGAGLGSMLLGQRLGAMLTAVTTGALAEWVDLRFAFAVIAVIAFAVLSVTLHRASAAKHAPAA